jgi:hypothetical protein
MSKANRKSTGRSSHVSPTTMLHLHSEPLTAYEQRSLHKCLHLLINIKNQIYLTQVQTDDENALSVNNGIWSFNDFCKNLNQCKETAYFYGHFSKLTYFLEFHKDNGSGEEHLHLMFKIDLNSDRNSHTLRFS